MGDIAGDMFIAAVLSVYPDLEKGLRNAIYAVGLEIR
jgi:hypothetical protein